MMFFCKGLHQQQRKGACAEAIWEDGEVFYIDSMMALRIDFSLFQSVKNQTAKIGQIGGRLFFLPEIPAL